MSYVSLENSESFLKCFEVIAEDKSCIVSDSVLYFSGKTGKGFIAAAGRSTGIEMLAINLAMLSEDLTFHFAPSGPHSYILNFDEIESAVKSETELSFPAPPSPLEKPSSLVSIADATKDRTIVYPKARVIRSIIVRVRQ